MIEIWSLDVAQRQQEQLAAAERYRLVRIARNQNGQPVHIRGLAKRVFMRAKPSFLFGEAS